MNHDLLQRRIWMIAGVVCISLAFVALRVGKSDSATPDVIQTFRLTSDITFTHYSGKAGRPGPGENLVSSGRIISSDDRRIGRVSTVAILTNRKRAIQFTVTIVVHGSQLGAQGSASLVTKEPLVLPLVGGTGEYLGARGSLEIGSPDVGEGELVINLLD